MEVVLRSADTIAGTEIARRLHVSMEAVSRIRRRFPDTGVAGLATRPKAGRKDHAVPAATVERLVELALSPLPAGRRRWNHAAPRAEVGSHSGGVSDVLRHNGLKPPWVRAYKYTSTKTRRDPDFVANVHDRVGLCLNPPEPSSIPNPP
jgi:hypothetical protein